MTFPQSILHLLLNLFYTVSACLSLSSATLTFFMGGLVAFSQVVSQYCAEFLAEFTFNKYLVNGLFQTLVTMGT